MARESQENDGQRLQEEEELIQDMMFQKRRCCFCIPTFKSDRSTTTGGSPWWGRIRATENEERWWSKGWMKVREWSELMAGPKWKTFIRRFNRNTRSGGATGCGKQGKFHYDPLSYALNFDQGPGHDGEPDEDLVFRDFSSRYASIPISAKSSMDLGKDGPSFI